MNITSDTQQMDTNKNKIAVNNEQQEDPNYMTVKSSNEDTNENNATCTRYGRIVKRPNRLTYYYFIKIFLIKILSICIHSINL